MSRGRQKRVEKNHQRRMESKKQKALKELRSSYKALVQTQLFPILDTLFDVKRLPSIRSDIFLHIWVDQLPSSRRVDDTKSFSEEDVTEKKHFSADVNVTKKTRRKSTTSDSETSTMPFHESNDDAEEILLCRSQFFWGECSGFKIHGKHRKKSAGSQLCKLSHYSSNEVTLFQALLPSLVSGNSQDKILHEASLSAALAQIQVDDTVGPDPDHVNAIDMLYHIAVSIAGAKPDVTASQLISQYLVSENVPISSIAYAVYSNNLLYDRFGGGKMVSEEDLHKLSHKTFGDQDYDDKRQKIPIFSLSTHLLETILSFLPSEYCGILPSCCKLFYSEIGVHSPEIWKQLLKRSNWSEPILDSADKTDECDIVLRYKETFINHFNACRQVCSLAEGILNMLRNSAPLPNHAMTKAGFNLKNDDAIVCIWDENTVLIASASECFLRLCSVAELNSKHICEEVVGLRIAPTPFSKRKKWLIKSVAVDDRYVASVYETVSVENSTPEIVVTTIMKDQLLTSSADDDFISAGEFLQCYQVRDLVFKFLDDRILQLGEHQNNNGFDSLLQIWQDGGFIRFSLDMTIGIQSPCGNGIFCSTIKLKSLGEPVFEGVFTFSASMGRDFIRDLFAVNFSGVVCSTNYQTKRRMDLTDVLIGSDHLHDLILVSVDRNGKFQVKQLASEDVDVVDEDAIVSCKSLIGKNVVLSCLVKEREIDEGRILVYCSHKDELSPEYRNRNPPVTLRNSYSNFVRMNFIMHDEYLIILASGEAQFSNVDPVYINWDNNTSDESEPSQKRLDFILVHVSTKTEIFRSSIRHPDLFDDDHRMVPFQVNLMQHGTITVAISGVGICFIDAAKCCSKDRDCNDLLTKVKKLKVKKRLVAKTGRGGTKQGTGLVKL